MKKIISVILVLCMVLTFAACSGDDETPDGMKNVAADTDAYYLYVPQSWVQNNYGVGAYYSAVDRSNVTIAAYSGEEYESSDAYWKAFTEEVKGFATDFTVIEEKEPKVISGRNAVQYTYSLTVGGVKYKVQQIMLAYSNIMYVITYTAEEGFFDSHAEDVKRILDEFRFK